ncbi:hypothetical protein PSACC_01118 [Paramicrosporidium saccamoebae]|uniref:C3H1-type domain-containing protein n=1 Tax=Paramicrosporidium saccamoebae TaxID=1246581 RepID=A0A2H9TMV1_9FUNG|nr:hypothetical protein PSACC_01118 [Paramicrosporidium saccamoebae]
MPPKAAQQQSSKKSEAKAKAKTIEDKTFGLKNKNKSAKVGKYIQQVETQVKTGGKRHDPDAEARAALKERKRAEEEKKAEIAALFKPVVQQKVPPGVDPKTVVCSYFKSGQCQKGDKCKFSHDLTVERKAAKINLYEDRRAEDGTEDGEERETMQDWDQNKLEQVVERKHQKGAKTTTDIVCKHFLDAIEKQAYGWFWECPNGGDSCKYRHALPPGFVLKSAKKERPSEQEELSLEEFLETERYRIEKKTPVTAESFLKWKADRKAKQELEERQREKEKESQIKAGKMLHASGRDLFMYNPEMFMVDDDEEAMDVDYTRREDDEMEEIASEVVDELVDEDAFLDEDLENLDIDELE